jgi:hypothetical protein
MGSFGEYKLYGKSTQHYVLLVPVTLQDLNTELVYFGILKKSIEEKKGINIEKYVEKKLHIKINGKQDCRHWVVRWLGTLFGRVL